MKKIITELGYFPPYYNIESSSNSLNGTNGLTIVQDGSIDDGFIALDSPFPIYFLGTQYSTVFVGSNSYLTFVSGSSAYYGINGSNPPYPSIQISTADNSYQRVYTGITNSGLSYVVRYEGYNGTSGAPGSPGIVWEVKFLAGTENIIFTSGVNGRGFDAAYGISDGSIYIQNPIQLATENNSVILTKIQQNYSLNKAENGVYGSINTNSAIKPNGLKPNRMSEWRGYDNLA